MEGFTFITRPFPYFGAQITHNRHTNRIFGVEHHWQISVPFVDVHKQKVAITHVNANSILGKARFRSGIAAFFNDRKITESFFIVTAILVNRGLKVDIGGDGGKRRFRYSEVGFVGFLSLFFVIFV